MTQLVHLQTDKDKTQGLGTHIFFLFSLRRRIWVPFSFISCAGEFSHHFVCGKSLQGTVRLFVFSHKTVVIAIFFF